MRVMVVDRSGRGHCIAWTLAQHGAERVHYVPGCGGIDDERIQCAQHLSLQDPLGLIDYAREHRIELVVVANAVALVGGVADAFRTAGFPTVGPGRRAARLESSKVHAKSLFSRYGIPTADHRSFRNPADAMTFVKQNPEFRVVKADGLCGGNGAVVCESEHDALQAIDRMMRLRVFGEAGDQVVIEKRLYGQELSFFAVLDANGWCTLPMAIDYPKTDDGNRGPISGGMGAISHHPLETPELVARIERDLLKPLHSLIADEQLPYTGFVYLGVMVRDGQPFLLETNVRMGEPETEVILPRLEGNLMEVFQATIDGQVSQCRIAATKEYLCDVVAVQGSVRLTNAASSSKASLFPGWPVGDIGVGQIVRGVDQLDPTKCHAFIGEARQNADGCLVSDGGRVVHIVGRGATLDQASRNAYDQIGHVRFNGMRYRHDIGTVMPWDTLVPATPTS